MMRNIFKFVYVCLACSPVCSVSSSSSPLGNFLVAAWQHLKWKHLTLIMDDLHPFTNTALTFIQDLQILHNEHFVRNVNSEFEFLSKENYVIVSEEPCNVMDVAEEYLTKHNRSSMLPHWTKFLIVVTSQHTSYLRHCLREVRYDNVMVVFYDDVTSDVISVETLMWRPNNVRELSGVFTSMDSTNDVFDGVTENYDEISILERSSDVNMFPNLKYGMNDRQLLCLCKVWDGDLIISQDASTGKPIYVGFVMDILELLSMTLNFTCSLTPDPGHPVHWEPMMSGWDNHTEVVARGDVDIGLSLWTTLNVNAFKGMYSVSFPFGGTASYTAAYLVHDHVTDTSDGKVLPGGIVGLLLFGLLLWTVLSYQLISRATENLHLLDHKTCRYNPGKITENNTDNRLEIDHTSPKKLVEDHLQNSSTVSPKKLVVDYLQNDSPMSPKKVADELQNRSTSTMSPMKVHASDDDCQPPQGTQFQDTIFSFIGTFFNQDLQLTPQSTALRCVVATWAFSGIFLTNIYTSYITADNITPPTSLPVSTFEELLQGDHYTFCVETPSTVDSALKHANMSSVLGRIYSRVLETRSVTNACDTHEGAVHQLLTTPNTVLLQSQAWRHEDLAIKSKKLNVTVLRLDELLFNLNRGFIFPTTSEFKDVVSKKLMELDEQGITTEIRNTKWSYEELLSQKRQEKDGFSGNDDLKPADVSELMWLFEVCGVCVGVAFVVLLVENMISCIFCKTLQSDVTDVRPDEEEPVEEKRMDGENILSLDLNGGQSYCHESETEVS